MSEDATEKGQDLDSDKEQLANSPWEEPKQDGAGLEKKLTLFNGITIIVGSIIGSGIFVSPKGVLQEVGSLGASLIVWTICGIFSLIGAYCYAELGCMIRDSGADYAYVYRAFGPLLAFLRLWVESVVIRPVTQAIVALAFAKYVIFPFFPDCQAPASAESILAAACIILLATVNCCSIKLSTWVQNSFTVGKCLALLLIIVTGFVQLGMGKVDEFKTAFEGTTTDVTKMALSAYSGLFAFTGWNYLNFVIEELKHPRRDLPRAIVISCILCTVIYLCTLVAYHSTVTVAQMLYTPAVAVLFAQKIYGSYVWWIMPVFVSMSCFGTVNGILFTSARLCYVAGRNGHMPKLLNMVHMKQSTPVPAVLFTAILGLIYLTTDIYVLINYLGFVNTLAIGTSVVILIYFRKIEPDLERPIKVWLGWPIIYVSITTFLLIFAFIASPMESGMGLVIMLTGLPVYVICVSWTNKPKSFNNFWDKLTICLQKILLIVPEDKKIE